MTFLTLPLFIRVLGNSQYGVLVLLGSLTAPMGLLNLGFSQSTVKYVAESLAQQNIEKASRYVKNTLIFNLAIGLAMGLGLSLSAPRIISHFFHDCLQEPRVLQSCLIWTGVTLVITQCGAALTAVPTAMQHLKVVSCISLLLATLSLLFSLVALLFGCGLLTVIRLRCFVSLGGFVVWYRLVLTVFPSMSLLPRFDREAFGNCFKFGMGQTLGNLGGQLANHSDKYLLGIYLSPEAVALFNVPYLTFTTVFTLVTKLSESIFPAISDLRGRGDMRRSAEVLLRSAALLSMIMVCLQGTLFVFAQDILRVYLGQEFASRTSAVLKIFAVTSIVAAPSIVMTQFLLASGSTAWIGITAILGGGLTFAVSCLLIPSLGLAGAAWSDLLAILFTRPFIHWCIWKDQLRDWVPARRFLSAFYGMSLLGLPATVLLDRARQQVDWLPGWPGLCVELISGPLLLAGALLLAEKCLPGPSSRLADLQCAWRSARVRFSSRPYC